MYLKQVNKILLTSLISICTANVAFASDKTTSDITHEVTSYEKSAYGELKGFVATKSSTGSKMDVDISEIPQSLSVVSSDMMRTRNAQTIQSITAYTAAINQPYGENGDKRTNYGRIRGTSFLYKSSFLDGLKLLYGGHLIPKIDAYALERVEVLKGPASVLYGASGPGGLLNLQSKKPNDSLSKEIGVSYGTKNNKSVYMDTNHLINEDLSLRLTGKIKKGDNELQGSTNESYFFNPSLSYVIDDDTVLDVYTSLAKDQTKGLGISFAGSKSILNYHNSIKKHAIGIAGAFGKNAAYVTSLQNSADEVNNLNLSSDLLIGLPDEEIFEKNHKSISTVLTKRVDEDIKIKSNMRYMQMNGVMDYSIPSSSGLVPLLLGASPDLTQLPMEFIQGESSLKTFAMDNNLQYSWNTKNTQNVSLLGIDFQYSKLKDKTKQAVQYVFDLRNPYDKINITKSSILKEDLTSTILQTGLHAQNSMKIKEKFIITTSLRYDKLKNTQEDHLTNKKTTQNDDNISGRIGFNYLFDNGVSPYVTYTTSFMSNIGSDYYGEQFKPSTAQQYEIGVKYKPSNMNALFTIAAFTMEESNLVKMDPDPLHSGKQIQQGNAEIKGIEFDIVASPSENLNMTYSFSKIIGKEVNMPDPDYEGRVLNDLPKFTTSLWADYTFKATKVGDLKFGSGIKYVGKAKNQNTDHFDFANGTPNKLYDVDDYTVVDAVVATKYKSWNIAMNIFNLFDKHHKLDTNAVTTRELGERTYTLSASYKF